MDSLIFDIDGTLWDSTAVVAGAWNEILESEAHLEPFITVPLLKTLFGKTLPDIAAALFPNESRSRQLELIDLCCRQEELRLRQKSAPLYPKLPEVLQELSKHHRLYIVSNCQAGYIETFLDCTGLGSLFEDHLCPADTGNPKADNIREIICRHNLKASAYIGDTLLDYQSTKAVSPSLPFIYASYGFGEVPDPDYIIREPMDLLSLDI